MPRLSVAVKRSFCAVLIAILSMTAVLLASSMPIGGSAGMANTSADLHAGSVTTELSSDARPDGMVVNIGLQVKNIYDLSLADQSFLADGWYWLNWGDDVQASLDRLRVEPSQIVEFANEIEQGQFSVSEVLPETLQVRSDAPHSLYVKFSGKFYINDVAQRLAPFDRQNVKIALEVKPSSLTKSPNRISLIPLPVEQLPIAGEFSSVSGFILTNTEWSRQQVSYFEPLSNHEQSAADVTRPSINYSRVTAVFTYAPDTVTVFLKWLLPLIAVMGIVILSPSIDGALGDVRLAIPSAALLTLVVLHDGYKNNFPPAPYLTYLDEIYTYSYLVCFAIFVLFLVGTNAHSRSSDADQASVTRRVNQLDLIVQVSTVTGFLLISIIGWFT